MFTDNIEIYWATFATIIVNGTAYTQSGTRLTTSSDEINDIYVQVSQNLSTSGRSATFNIGHFFDWESTQENEKINVTINQAAFEPGIVPSTSSITMEYNDSGATFNVNSNIVYNASISNTTYTAAAHGIPSQILQHHNNMINCQVV